LERRCDSTPDCPDDSDELEAECGKIYSIVGISFKPLPPLFKNTFTKHGYGKSDIAVHERKTHLYQPLVTSFTGNNVICPENLIACPQRDGTIKCVIEDIGCGE